MHFYLHIVLRQIYVCLSRQPEWVSTLPNGSRAPSRCTHMYARLAPDQGQPARECGPIPVFEAMFQTFLKEVSPEQAHQVDPSLVEYSVRAQSYPSLHTLQLLVSPGAQLHLVDCGQTEDRCLLFDVYLVPAVSHAKFVYLNPMLVHLFPTRILDGVRRVLVPFPREEFVGGILLAHALAARIWGEQERAPAFTFEIAY
ncbi:MAG TPA: hypothetical protein VFV38_39820 [Ktedonobacteraceae bacterium]|nr:hypothetical protein [Ktedonobacteraceae bacterium]